MFFIPINDSINSYEDLIIIKDDKQNELKKTILNYCKYSIEYCTNKIIFEINKKNFEIFDNNNIKENEIENYVKSILSKNNNKKTLNFGQSNICKDNDLYQKLEEFEIDNNKLANNIHDISTNSKIKSGNIINDIKNLCQKMDEISNLLKCNCSDNTQFPKIEEKLNNIKNYFEQLKSLLQNFLKYIIDKDVITFITSYNNCEKSLKSMLKNMKIIIPISNFNQNININSIKQDSNALSSFIVYEEEQKVNCSQNDIKLDFGSCISSIIKGDFLVYILSIINEKLYSSISFDLSQETGTPETKYEKNIIINNEIQPNELFPIAIKLPKKTKEEDEDCEINFTLKLGNDKISELELPCSFKFILSSLKISIESLNYKLLIKDREDRELHLCTTFIEEKEIITFKIESLNRNTKLDFKVSYQSNKENEVKEPKLIKEDNLFKIEFENEYYDIDIKDRKFQFKKFEAIFYIYITNTIFIPIIINAKITPFKFTITAYDFNNHELPSENNLIVYYGREQLNEKQKLFFKIGIIDNKKNYKGTIKIIYNNNLNIIQKSLSDEFEISESLNFNIEYKIEKVILNEIEMEIIICINGLTKKFQVNIKYVPKIFEEGSEKKINTLIYPTKIPLYIYKIDKTNKYILQKINNVITENPETNLFVSPFDICGINPINIKGLRVELSIKPNEKDNNYFYVMNNIGDCKKEKDDNINPPGSFNILVKKEKKTIKIPLIGEYNQIWYPTVNDFNLDKIKQIDILEYKDENE